MPSGVYKRTEGTRIKMSKVKKGIVTWNKGKHYFIPKKHKENISEGCKKSGVGKWMKGKKHSLETLEKMSESHRKNPTRYWLGKKKLPLLEETKKKISEAKLGKCLSEKTKDKIREWHINHPNRKFKNTSIELKIEAELKKRNINYQKQVPLCKIAIVDFYLPEYRIIIECDGDYWHNREKTKIRDEEKTKVLTFNGFNVYRFWEHEIKESVENCIDKIWQITRKTN